MPEPARVPEQPPTAETQDPETQLTEQPAKPLRAWIVGDRYTSEDGREIVALLMPGTREVSRFVARGSGMVELPRANDRIALGMAIQGYQVVNYQGKPCVAVNYSFDIEAPDWATAFAKEPEARGAEGERLKALVLAAFEKADTRIALPTHPLIDKTRRGWKHHGGDNHGGRRF